MSSGGRGIDTGATPGYRAGATLPVRVELTRQLRRRRTQVTLGFLVLLPGLLWLAFTLGEDDGEGVTRVRRRRSCRVSSTRTGSVAPAR